MSWSSVRWAKTVESGQDVMLEDSQEELDRKSNEWQTTYARKRRGFSLQVVLAIGFTILGFAFSNLLQQRASRPELRSPVPLEITGSRTPTLWMPDDTFNPPGGRTAESDRAWESRHKRYVVIENPADYGLAPSEEGVSGSGIKGQIYAVSTFHQMHCLRLMRYSWYEALNRGSDVLNNYTGIPNAPPSHALGPHIDHCFDFIRQAIECSPDYALEPFVGSDGVTPTKGASSGWGTTHYCRNFDALVEWIDERNVPRLEPDWKKTA